MRLVIQRVSQASVKVEGKEVGAIGSGALVLFGATHGDTPQQCVWLASKLVHLRMFSDASNKMNRSLLENKWAVLIVSQFTLYADCRGGRRPSFTAAAPPEQAASLYNEFIKEVKNFGLQVATGIFGAYMQVSLLNDGPVTFLLDV